jgi:secreted trypsin-like serine protease
MASFIPIPNMTANDFCKRVLSLIAFVSMSAVVSCSGGGGGSNESSSDFTLNACSAIGLKVANGVECKLGTTVGTSPLVRVQIITPNGVLGICTGTAINSNSVLTAAHCFLDGASDIQIDTFLGSHQANEYFIHPGFVIGDGELEGSKVLFNDLAIIKTSTPMQVSTFPILASRTTEVGEEAIVAGFGQTEPESDFGILNAGNAIIANQTPNHIFIDFSGGQSHPCQGDSGGPLLVSQSGSLVIAGVVSQTDPSVSLSNICKNGDVSLYTSIQSTSALNFISVTAGVNVGFR